MPEGRTIVFGNYEAPKRFKPIPSFEGLYSISELGEVWSHKTGIILRHGGDKLQGYSWVNLRKEGRSNYLRVSRLILLTFVGSPPDPGWDACHKDDNSRNTCHKRST